MYIIYMYVCGLATTTGKVFRVEIAPSKFLLGLFMCYTDKFCKFNAGRNFQKMRRIVLILNVSIFVAVFSAVT